MTKAVFIIGFIALSVLVALFVRSLLPDPPEDEV